MTRQTLSKQSTGEPSLNPNKDTKEQVFSLINWYNYNKDEKDAIKYFNEYLESNNIKLKYSEKQVPSSIGWACRIFCLAKEHSHLLPSYVKTRIDGTIDKIKNKVERKETEIILIEKPTVNIKDNLQRQYNSYISEIEFQIDTFLTNNFKNDFNFGEYFSNSSVKFNHAEDIAKHYKNGLLKELSLVGIDEDVTEAYSNFSKSQMKKYIAFVNHIIEVAEERSVTAKIITQTNRKPRTVKKKSPLKQVEKLKFLKEKDDLKSIVATKIIGSEQLWVYVPEKRTLGVYNCDNFHGFGVKGSTILNFDSKTSVSKKLRKPDDILPKILKDGKVSIRKLFDSIKSKEKKLNGRVNSKTLLLRAI